MGGRRWVAGLLLGLVGMVAGWGSEAAPAQRADAWKLKVLTAGRFNEQGAVQVDVRYDCASETAARAVAAAGLTVNSSVRLASFCVVEGWAEPKSLSDIAFVAGVEHVTLPTYAVHPVLKSTAAAPAASAATVIDNNAVLIMHADQFISQTGTNGTGAKVGVQSGGISNLETIQSRGELPTVQVVKPSDGAASSAGDEGTVLLEEIHAVAPGASLTYCGPNTYVEYTSCLSQMIAVGATILVDDLIFPQQDLLAVIGREITLPFRCLPWACRRCPVRQTGLHRPTTMWPLLMVTRVRF